MAAVVVGKADAALDAAEYLVATDGRAAEGLLHLARQVLALSQSCDGTGQADPASAIESTRRAAQVVHQNREHLAEFSRDPIAWTDLARGYASLGAIRKADRAIATALGLAPHNRFVLRAAVRLNIHCKRFEAANDLLIASPRTARDPWLMSAEIATAALAERTPRTTRQARRFLVNGGTRPRDISELAAELGTLELHGGNSRKARKLFRRALEDPNENALAQIEWATSDPSADQGIDPTAYGLPFTFEACAGHAFRMENWAECIHQLEGWMVDEPFSATPSAKGSYVAIAMLDRSDLAEQFAVRGLTVDPDNPLLLNNLAVALARQGRISEAEERLSRIRRSELNTHGQVIIQATTGLICMRSGNLESGRRYYAEAIELALTNKLTDLAARAGLNLLYEEAVVDPRTAGECLTLVDQIPNPEASPEVAAMRKRLQLLAVSGQAVRQLMHIA